MSRRPLLFRVLITLVAAWYGLIAGGQLSLAESAVNSVHLATGSQPAPHGATVMAGMDCHSPAAPNGQKRLCLCIDSGLFQLGLALPSKAQRQTSQSYTPVRVLVRRQQFAAAYDHDYLLPPATAPPQA